MVYLVTSGEPAFPDGLKPDENGLVALGGELSIKTITEAYTKGIFPWTGLEPIPWFSPDPRLVLFPSELRVARSLRQVIRSERFSVRMDQDFGAIIEACRSQPRPGQTGTWITPNMVETYTELFARGMAHGVGVYEDSRLVGGLYGLSFGRGFFGESMFSREKNASKVALWALCRRLVAKGFAFIDCQEITRHLVSLGAVALERGEYLGRLRACLEFPSQHERWSET